MSRSWRHFAVVLAVAAVIAGCGSLTSREPVVLWEPLASPPVDGSSEGYVEEPVFGGRMFVYQAGPKDAPPVVLVHGLGSQGAGDWRHIVPALAREYRVITIDLPGFARSERHDALYSPERYDELLNWVIERYVGGPVTLVGHSMGGTLVLRHATTHPQNLERLVLVSPAGLLHRAAYAKHLVAVREGSVLARSSEVEEAFNNFVGRIIEGSQRLNIDMLELLSNPARRNLFFGSNPIVVAGAAMIEQDFSAALGRLEVPTLIVWGRDDAVTPLRTGPSPGGANPHRPPRDSRRGRPRADGRGSGGAQPSPAGGVGRLAGPGCGPHPGPRPQRTRRPLRAPRRNDLHR